MKVNIAKSIKNLIRVYGQKASYKTGLVLSRASNIFLTLTYRCNFRCENCAIWKLPKKKELTTKEWIDIAKNLEEWMGFGTITLNGGEPLIRKDIFEIVKKIKNPNFYITLNSNGYIISEKTANAIVSSKINEVKISLYSLNKKTHEKLRGMPDAFNRAISAIDNLSQAREKAKSKLVISIGVLVTYENLKEIPKMIEWAKSKNVSLILQSLDEEFEIQQIDTQKNKWWKNCRSWPRDKKEVVKVFSEISVLKRRNYPVLNSPGQIEDMKNYYLNPNSALKTPCMVGEQNVIVDPYGKVRLCFRGSFVGDLKKQEISEIWKCKEIKREREIIKNCKLACRIVNCNYSVGLKDRVMNFLKRAKHEIK